MLPTLAVMLAIVWYCLEIWESHTFARLRERLHWEEKAAARRVKAEAAVAAQTVLVEAAEAVKQAVETQLPKE
jgi:hypothetical protein